MDLQVLPAEEPIEIAPATNVIPLFSTAADRSRLSRGCNEDPMDALVAMLPKLRQLADMTPELHRLLVEFETVKRVCPVANRINYGDG